MKRIWNWLTDDKNRDVVKMTAAGLATIVTGAWAILTFVVDHHGAPSVMAAPNSVAAGRDVSGNTINFGSVAGTVSTQAKPP